MVTPSTAPYKPSPLSFGSPRTSPFRRPSSPGSPSTAIRPVTPTGSPSRGHTPTTSPSKLNQSYFPEEEDNSSTISPSSAHRYDPPASPTRGANQPTSNGFSSTTMGSRTGGTIDADALSKLPPAQLREMREAFQVLDRDSDGQVNRDDVVDCLTNLGQDSSSHATSPFFPPGAPQSLSLPLYLSTLSTLLSPLSAPTELLNAFAAFDDDDSGQIDLAELSDALLHTAPEAGEKPLSEREIETVVGGFTGRRAFGGASRGMKTGGLSGGGKRGEVFRYGEFVGNVTGAAAGGTGKGEGEAVAA